MARCLAGLASAAILLASCTGSAHTARPGGSAISPADILSLQMFSSSQGVAVAFTPSSPPCERNCTRRRPGPAP